MSNATRAAWSIIEACGGREGLLRAAAGSSLYPHVWTRDVGLASLGILAAARTPKDGALVLRSLEAIAKHQDALGRMPLKVDVAVDGPVLENSAGVDASLWFVIAVDAAAQALGAEAVAHLVAPALKGMAWARHLDVNGDGLLETPEASDWADMMPHRHAVLFVNVLYVVALRAAARIDAHRGAAEAHTREADRVRARVRGVFRVHAMTDVPGVTAHLERAAAWNPEMGLTGQYASRYGELPFLLPYVAFRAVGTHCDIVGNLLAVLADVLEPAEAARLLDYLDAVGAADPAPTKTVYPPLTPGHPDWRDHFHWRNLNLPHHYQNGGSWPFAGALHVAALVHAGRASRARELLGALEGACLGEGAAHFPEWQHGVTGRPMGERDQLWSAAGLLHAHRSVETGRAPFFRAAGR